MVCQNQDLGSAYFLGRRRPKVGSAPRKFLRTNNVADVGWAFEERVHREEDRYVAYLKSRQLKPRSQCFGIYNQEHRQRQLDADSSTHKSGTSGGGGGGEVGDDGVTRGEERFRLFIEIVRKGISWSFKNFQVEFIRKIIKTLAPNIIGAEAWAICGARIMKEFGWDRIPPSVLAAAAPRRFGKTVVIASIQLAYALVYGGQVQGTFSTGGRASAGIRDYVTKTADESGYADALITKGKSVETLLISSIYNHERPSVLNYYPANGKICPPLSRTLSRVACGVFVHVKVVFMIGPCRPPSRRAPPRACLPRRRARTGTRTPPAHTLPL